MTDTTDYYGLIVEFAEDRTGDTRGVDFDKAFRAEINKRFAEIYDGYTPKNLGTRNDLSPHPGGECKMKAQPTEHKLKTRAPYWKAIQSGHKTFEVRRDDRGFQKGDILVLEKTRDDDPHLYDMDGFGFDAEPKSIRKRVSYILTGGQFGREPGVIVMGLQDV